MDKLNQPVDSDVFELKKTTSIAYELTTFTTETDKCDVYPIRLRVYNTGMTNYSTLDFEAKVTCACASNRLSIDLSLDAVYTIGDYPLIQLVDASYITSTKPACSPIIIEVLTEQGDPLDHAFSYDAQQGTLTTFTGDPSKSGVYTMRLRVHNEGLMNYSERDFQIQVLTKAEQGLESKSTQLEGTHYQLEIENELRPTFSIESISETGLIMINFSIVMQVVDPGLIN